MTSTVTDGVEALTSEKVLAGLNEVITELGSLLSVPGFNRVKDAILYIEARPQPEGVEALVERRVFEPDDPDWLHGLAAYPVDISQQTRDRLHRIADALEAAIKVRPD